MGIVTDRQDLLNQLHEIQQERDESRLEKLLLDDEQLLDTVMGLKLPPQMTDGMKEMLTCPITLDFMHGPVILVQSGQTFDRESLCGRSHVF